VNLVSLDISSNRLISFEGLAQLQNLRTLNAADNKIASAVAVNKLRVLGSLSTLVLKGNPISMKR
jgi:Leucine-rich repeat (LRR) protein